MAVRHANLDELERRRLELEGNIQNLRKSLYDWRLREAEYDGLKDEIKNLQNDCTGAEILRVGLEYEGTVVDEKEVRDIIGEKQNITRSRDQVVSQITRRLDYVKQNVTSLEKRLSAAESELDRLLSVERPGPNAATEEYAVTEIFEELDENGDVISSKVSNPADRAPEIMDMLKKAGVEVPQGQESEKKDDDKMDANKDGKAQSFDSVTDTAVNKEQPSPSPAKTVVPAVTDTITDEFDDSDSEPPVLEVDESPEDAKLRREMLEYSFHEVGRVVAELEMDDEGSDISVDEDYDYDDDDYEEDEDEYGRTTTAVLTEEYHQQMKDLEERLKAGGFINLGPAKNIDAEAKETAEAASHGGVLKVTAIERDANNDTTLEETKKPKKKVAFAEDLDIAQKSTPPTVPVKTELKIDVVKSEVTPLSESIVERSTSKSSTAGSKYTTDTASTKKKTSRFKSARKDGTPTPGDSTTAGIGPGQQSSILKKSEPAPSSLSLFPAKPEGPKPFSQPIIAGDVFATASATKPSIDREAQPPEGKITAETLVERPVNDKTSVLPPDPDEIDEEIHRKEVATEFYRRRNLKIQQSGGFLKDEDNEDEADQLYELDENDQPKRKVSKFKAARLRS
jgi:unconventional prefoldin RPB5 interactor 1